MDRAESIHLLNKAVADELQAVHQYMYFHFHLTDQGFGPLAMLLKQTAIQEMGHVELLAERVLFLKGDVEMVAAGPVEKIVEPEAIVVKAMAMEEGAPGIITGGAQMRGQRRFRDQTALRATGERRGTPLRPVREAARQHQEVRPELSGASVLRRRCVPRGAAPVTG